MKFYILFLFTILIHQFSFAQEENKAIILFNDGTSIEGIGEIKRNTIYFKVAPEDTYTEWDYTSAKGIIFSGYGYSEKYEYAKTDKNSNPVIMEVVDEGFVTLYRKNKMVFRVSTDYNHSPYNSVGPFAGNNFISEDMSTTYYVQRKEESFATNITSGFKAKSLKYFSDCKALTEKIYDRTFTVDKIKAMVDYYNNYCYEEEN
jgi:hypothetical protein